MDSLKAPAMRNRTESTAKMNWTAADITIAVEIYTEDGTVLRKTILIQPHVVGPDSEGMSSVKISVLDS